MLVKINFIFEEFQLMFSENAVDIRMFHGRGTAEPSLLCVFVFMFSFRLGTTNTENSVLIMSSMDDRWINNWVCLKKKSIKKRKYPNY